MPDKDRQCQRVVRLEVNGPVAVVTLRRPPINALDEAALNELLEVMDRVESDDAVHAVVIASGLDKVFCAGGDLKYWPYRYPTQADVVSGAGRFAFTRIERLLKPTIAAIGGSVVGDGISLALACDLRLAAPEVVFQLPELDYGFIPGWGTMGRLVRAVGHAMTAEFLFLGRAFNAERAQAIGLINRVVDSEDLMPTVFDMAECMARKPPRTVRWAKAALCGETLAPDMDRHAWEISCFTEVWGGEEWAAGLEKFSFRK